MAHAYTQVYTDLLEKIRNDTYPIGSLLPPEPELEKIYGVSRTTVRRAISLLSSANIVKVKQGYGTEVLGKRTPPRENLFRFHGITKVTEERSSTNSAPASPMAIDTVPAPAAAAEFLGLRPGAPVYRIQRLSLFADGTVFGYKVNYISPKDFPKLDRFNGLSISLYSLMYEKYKVLFDHGDEKISATVADFFDSQIFKTEIGNPLLLLTRRAYSLSGPLEYAEYKILPEHYSITIHMEGSPYPYDTWN